MSAKIRILLADDHPVLRLKRGLSPWRFAHTDGSARRLRAE